MGATPFISDQGFNSCVLAAARLVSTDLHRLRAEVPCLRQMTRTPLLLLATLLVGGTPGDAAVVERVIDGDTLVLRGGTRIRLACMDAPERGQPGAAATTRRLRHLTAGGVQVEPLTTDRFGRTVAEVWTPAGVNVGKRLVEEGLARIHPRYRDQCAWSS
ncbi:hypothetical protein EVJ50_11980 [Synechococcus sp. RSCCF101]|uniref:thermonuclease family protein n=1 Tax=Synechococcus sp. RSCCF101 TaxID=2511069 RepID=UPI0012491B07|nr:thermonuclease family protein [Synechococcus sp. RSCCF101]QEY32846.1 hypothetical protein EVJ50_11980 [Synechococcus sp. RSCCF101]